MADRPPIRDLSYRGEGKVYRIRYCPECQTLHKCAYENPNGSEKTDDEPPR